MHMCMGLLKHKTKLHIIQAQIKRARQRARETMKERCWNPLPFQGSGILPMFGLVRMCSVVDMKGCGGYCPFTLGFVGKFYQIFIKKIFPTSTNFDLMREFSCLCNSFIVYLFFRWKVALLRLRRVLYNLFFFKLYGTCHFKFNKKELTPFNCNVLLKLTKRKMQMTCNF